MNKSHPHCLHNLPCAQKQVQKNGPNRGRFFWICPNALGDACNFFMWNDEAKLPFLVPELWQEIFQFLPLDTTLCLSRICRQFVQFISGFRPHKFIFKSDKHLQHVMDAYPQMLAEVKILDLCFRICEVPQVLNKILQHAKTITHIFYASYHKSVFDAPDTLQVFYSQEPMENLVLPSHVQVCSPATPILQLIKHGLSKWYLVKFLQQSHQIEQVLDLELHRHYVDSAYNERLSFERVRKTNNIQWLKKYLQIINTMELATNHLNDSLHENVTEEHFLLVVEQIKKSLPNWQQIPLSINSRGCDYNRLIAACEYGFGQNDDQHIIFQMLISGKMINNEIQVLQKLQAIRKPTDTPITELTYKGKSLLFVAVEHASAKFVECLMLQDKTKSYHECNPNAWNIMHSVAIAAGFANMHTVNFVIEFLQKENAPVATLANTVVHYNEDTPAWHGNMFNLLTKFTPSLVEAFMCYMLDNIPTISTDNYEEAMAPYEHPIMYPLKQVTRFWHMFPKMLQHQLPNYRYDVAIGKKYSIVEFFKDTNHFRVYCDLYKISMLDLLSHPHPVHKEKVLGQCIVELVVQNKVHFYSVYEVMKQIHLVQAAKPFVLIAAQYGNSSATQFAVRTQEKFEEYLDIIVPLIDGRALNDVLEQARKFNYTMLDSTWNLLASKRLSNKVANMYDVKYSCSKCAKKLPFFFAKQHHEKHCGK